MTLFIVTVLVALVLLGVCAYLVVLPFLAAALPRAYRYSPDDPALRRLVTVILIASVANAIVSVLANL